MISVDIYFITTSSILLGVLLLSVLVIISRTKNRGLFLLDSYFAGIVIYTLGVLILAFKNTEQEELFLLKISLANLLATFLFWFINRLWSSNGVRFNDFLFLRTNNKIFANLSTLFLVLINLSFIYLVYTRVIQGHFSGAFVLLDIRKTIASGEAGYFAPGLIKQIRDVFAPAFVVWLVLFYQGQNKHHLIWFMFVVILASMILGGQRMPVLVLFISAGLSYYLKLRMENRPLSRTKLAVFSCSPLLIIFFLNILLGRGGDEEGFILSFVNLIFSIGTRILTTVPEENVHLISYISELKMEPFSLWISDLSIILPGTQEAFSNQLHSYLGGSQQGNAVLGAPLDIYVNSGVWGIFIVPAIVSVFLHITQVLLTVKRNPLSVSMFMVFVCYMPFCYSFYLFLLNGGLLVIFYSIYNLLIVRKKRFFLSGLSNSFLVK